MISIILVFSLFLTACSSGGKTASSDTPKASGRIGTVEHVQVVNNVPYGGVYFQDWYRNEQETGGLFLQKATHDFDYITYVLGQKPTSVCAMTSKQIFKGTTGRVEMC